MYDNKLMLEHAWKYFELHAQQRITVFNFYLAISGLVSTGIGICLQQGGAFNYISSFLCLFLMFVSFIFWKLDQRVSLLIKEAEKTLSIIERTIAQPTLHLFDKDNNNTALKNGIMSVWTYGRCFRCAFVIVGYSSFILFFAPWFIPLLTR